MTEQNERLPGVEHGQQTGSAEASPQKLAAPPIEEKPPAPGASPSGVRKTSLVEKINAFSAVIVAVATVIYASLTYKMLNETRSQTLLTQEPVLSVKPQRVATGRAGEITLVINNSGLSDVANLEVFEHYFVAAKPRGGTLAFYAVGFLSLEPQTTIPKIARGQSAPLELRFGKVNEQLTTLYLSPQLKGSRMKIVRLVLKYERELDRRIFSRTKVYAIAGSGDVLLDADLTALEGEVSFPEVKAALGATE